MTAGTMLDHYRLLMFHQRNKKERNCLGMLYFVCGLVAYRTTLFFV